MDGKPIFHFLNTSIFAEYTVVDSACVVKIHIDGDGDLNPYIKIKDLPYSVVAYLRVLGLLGIPLMSILVQLYQRKQ
ncbi:Alcohol dehydrogenase-like 4 [Glycine soja]|uniref:Alcohol dehydrogenase-like 4 n=1 Tax=Glycine soja TaxID=3848 RepID=A0A0B2PW21_GLYSO|nr:Alcohol dehydrogenase-like 4 [Glycine soja]